MKKLIIGILAHVDAGKTTLSESMLYASGNIRKMGRVDHGNTFLDTYELERERGITIFSKQAIMNLQNTQIILLDTPGHIDFSAEMERTLQVLDYAILVISGVDGVQGHTRTVWRLLEKYQIPVFLFINKMDRPETNASELLRELCTSLDSNCISFANRQDPDFLENVAMCDETVLEDFLETGSIEENQIVELIARRKLFPCFFGSALKSEGVEDFLQNLERYTKSPIYTKEFGAKVFKITRDEQGTRLTHMKITGGNLQAKMLLSNATSSENTADIWKEKVNQIRIYSGDKYEAVNEVGAGSICAVTGLTQTFCGEGLGAEATSASPVLEPVLTYQIILPPDCDANATLPKLRQIEEEEPQLHIIWQEELQEIQVQMMGEVQIEILKKMVLDRFGIEIAFGTGKILYKETIANTVEGVGHFEPLRHYSEVHLLLEPLPRGSGLRFSMNCSEDILDKNWQRLVLTHLMEKEHKGILTGSPITDMEISVVSGKAHTKHTEGGDFRQATYRAVRQGLQQADCILLEPYYEFRLEIPEAMIGRAMTDIEQMYGHFEAPVPMGEFTLLTGYAPVATMQNYQKEVRAYTKGCGQLSYSLKGYAPCHNTEEVLLETGYIAELDTQNPSSSVFCSHGTGFIVPWNEVPEYMHMPSVLLPTCEEELNVESKVSSSTATVDEWITTEEVDAILAKTYGANKKEKSSLKKSSAKKIISAEAKVSTATRSTSSTALPEYLLVDGYNIIFAWDDLHELSDINMNSAREKLMDILCNYQGIRKCELIVVFDAYRVQGHPTEVLDYHNIHVVYTKEAETADQYIEKFAHEKSKKYRITVATSDGLEQIIIRGQGCNLLSARDFQKEVQQTNEQLRSTLEQQASNRHYLLDSLPEKMKKEIEKLPEHEE